MLSTRTTSSVILSCDRLAAKKETREKEHAQAALSLKNLAVQGGITSGKWLFFCKSDAVDSIWEKIARAIIQPDGALRDLARTAKVATAQPHIEGEEVSLTASGADVMSRISEANDVSLVL